MLVYLAMIFTTLEVLSILFNQYFTSIVIFGITMPLNISVIFFCLAFFILDLVTELYDNKVADAFIYGKVMAQLLFTVLGIFLITAVGLQNTQLATLIYTTPFTILYGVIASIIGYKITTKIMQELKIYYHGEHLMLRYLLSTLPGEIVFSLIFSSLAFSKNHTMVEYFKILISLILVKLILSVLFSLMVVPITKIIKAFSTPMYKREFIPFK